jgi:hypothetical protein
MPDLDQQLRALASDVDWPPTPPLTLPTAKRQRSERRPLRWLAVAALAAAVALSVPAARSALLRVFHLGGVTVEHVGVLPAALERPLSADLGPVVTPQTAQGVLGVPARLPTLKGTPVLHLRHGVISVLLATPTPLLLSEFRTNEFLLKKIAGSETHVLSLDVGHAPGLWITGARHVFVLPAAPPRLAGDVLVWESGPITYRLEGRGLDKSTALKLATEIEGT